MHVVPLTLLALASAPVALGHTWIEQLRNVDPSGKYVGEYGYPRGMFSKTDPGYDGFKMNWQLPGNDEGSPYISANTTLCHPSQRKQEQSEDKYPRLQTSPGSWVAFRYMENGHVTLPNNQKGKPENGGTVFVYGTTQPKEDERLVDVLRWTEDGQGGDKRGFLFATNDFDDGRCYERNDSPESKQRQGSFPNFAVGQDNDGPGNFPLFCETNAVIPKAAEAGKPYTIYWVWQWNTIAGADPGLPKGKDEYHTTCMDVDIAETLEQSSSKAQFGLDQQDGMEHAVQDFAGRKALKTDAIANEQGPVFNSTSDAPSATGTGAPQPQPTFVTSTRKLTGTGIAIPTLSQRPGGKPTSAPAESDGVVRVTVTERVTVTATPTTPQGTGSAPAATTDATDAANKHDEHIAQHKNKRGISWAG